jgi:hypothetical protein
MHAHQVLSTKLTFADLDIWKNAVIMDVAVLDSL